MGRQGASIPGAAPRQVLVACRLTENAAMSQTAAIAAVTIALKTMLEQALAAQGVADRHLADVLVTTLPLDRARTTHHRCQLNFTLATVVENGAMRNTMSLGPRPSGSGQGAQAVDLMYLATAYGPEDDEIGAQRVLGAALRAVHEQPVLPAIALDVVFPHTGATGTLAQVRVTQAPLSREQIVACWLAFHTPYRLSAALQVTGVQLG
jgi:hypothetical protein